METCISRHPLWRFSIWEELRGGWLVMVPYNLEPRQDPKLGFSELWPGQWVDPLPSGLHWTLLHDLGRARPASGHGTSCVRHSQRLSQRMMDMPITHNSHPCMHVTTPTSFQEQPHGPLTSGTTPTSSLSAWPMDTLSSLTRGFILRSADAPWTIQNGLVWFGPNLNRLR